MDNIWTNLLAPVYDFDNLERLLDSGIKRMANGIVGLLQEILDGIDKGKLAYSTAMIDIGLVPSWSFTISDAIEITQECNQIQRRELVKVLFRNHVHAVMLERWGKHQALESCMPLLHSSMDCHMSENYTASVPLAFQAIEYALRSIDQNYKGKLTGGALNQHVEDHELYALHDRMKSLVGQIYEHTTSWVERPGKPLNRHAVIHGYDISYGTEWNSITAIFLFDYVQDILCVVGV